MKQPKHDALIMAASSADKARFWEKVTMGENCWLYRAASRGGYGAFYLSGVTINAHRVAKLWDGKKPRLKNLACHICRNKNCVRPSHIYWGTPASNAADKIDDGTSRPDTHMGSLHPAAILNEKDIIQIWESIGRGGVSAGSVAERYGVTASAIQRIISGKNWAHVTQHLPPIRLSRSERGMVHGEEHHSARLTAKKVQVIRAKIAQGARAVDVAAEMGVNKATIADIRHGRTWTHVE